MKKKIDCITFYNENLMFDIRYEILSDFVDYFIICESLYDHRGIKKKLNFNISKYKTENKIKYIIYEKPFEEKINLWKNQALQREYILKNLDFADDDDYIFFSDPDEIPQPEIIKNFNLNKKYGIFMQKFYNYKFNLFNKYESPWEGTRVAKKKNLHSIDYLRQKIKCKNLQYSFFRFDKEKSIEIFPEGGWHFNNIMEPYDISIKLKKFSHTEYSSKRFSDIEKIAFKIENKQDLFERGHTYQKVPLDNKLPNYVIMNKEKLKKFIL